MKSMKQLVTSAKPDDSPNSVELLIHEFAKKLPALGTRSGAANKCKFVSYELACYLRRRGFKARLVHVQHIKDKSAFPNAFQQWVGQKPTDWTHYMVKVDHRLYDLTARQFDPLADRVQIYTVPQVRSLWNEVELDKFMNRFVREILPFKDFKI